MNAKERRRNEAEQRLLDAAAELIGEIGPAAVTLANIGERAGYSRGLDYFRYRGVDSDMQMSVALANSGDVLSRSGFRSVAGRGGWQEAGAWLTVRVHRGREWARDRPLW
jgi:Bacterial regulatory proteins, tetR family